MTQFQIGDVVRYQPDKEPDSHYWRPRVGREYVVVEIPPRGQGELLCVWEPFAESGSVITIQQANVVLVARAERVSKAPA